MTNRERMNKGLLYNPAEMDILFEQVQHKRFLFAFNQCRPMQVVKKMKLLKKMFGSIGERTYIETPFQANFGGKHCFFGKYVYANSNLTCVDDGEIHVGDYSMFGPNVVLATAGHPILPDLRQKGLQYNMPIHIGSNCWIGAGVIVLPGITIGDNVVVGAGSVVTKDLPSNVIAVGNPCKVLREVNENDKKFYFKNREIDYGNF